MRPGLAYDDAALLQEARREVVREETRIQDSMRTIRWWAAGCLAVTTLHGALPFGLLTGLDGLVVRRVAACVIASLCGWAWAAWGSVRRLRPVTAPPGRSACDRPIGEERRLTPDRRWLRYGAIRKIPTPARG